MRLRERKEFSLLQQKGERLFGRISILQYLKKECGPPRLGLTVSKRYGKSVQRVQFKRYLRVAFCHWAPFLEHYDVNILPKKSSEHSISLQNALYDFEQFVLLISSKNILSENPTKQK